MGCDLEHDPKEEMIGSENESQRIADQLQRACFGGAWHGPSLKESLEGISPKEAAAHPIAGGHSIWEIVLHLTTWMREVRETIKGKPYESLKGDRDWPPVTDVSADAWTEAHTALHTAGEQLVATIQKFPAAELGASEQTRSPYHLSHGIVQHNLYHAGQIALLKRAARLI